MGICKFRGRAELVDDATEQHRLSFAGVTLNPKNLALAAVAPTLELRMAENPFIALFEGRPPCLIDVRLDVARIGYCEVVEAAVPALSVLVLRAFMLD